MTDQPKLTCHQVSRILSDGLDAELPEDERARLRKHMAICDACRQFEQQMALMRRALRGLGAGKDDEE